MSPLAAIGYPLFAAAAMNFAFGTFLLTRGSRKDAVVPFTAKMALISAVYCLTMGVAYVRASFGLAWNFYYRSAWVGWLVLAPLTESILILRGERRQARVWGAILYLVWGAILVLCWTTDLFEIGAASLSPFVGRAGVLAGPARAFGMITLGYDLYVMYRVRRESAGRKRLELGYFLLGAAIYASAGMLLAGLFPVIGQGHFDPGLVCYFSTAWMALVFYAITRHRLFDIRFVVSRGLAAIVLMALLATSNILAFRWLTPTLGAVASVTMISLISGAVLFMTPLVGLIDRATRRLFLRNRYDYQRAIKESAQALASIVSVDDLMHELLEVTRGTVGTSSGALLLDEDGHLVVEQSYGIAGAPRELPRDGALARWVSAHGKMFVRDEQERTLAEAELAPLDAELRAFAGEVAVPIFWQESLKGLLILGRKNDKDAFLQADVDLLETIANQAAIALANARLLEDLRRAVELRDDFLSVAGHELRTPLTALQLNVQSLLRSAPPSENTAGRLQATRRQVARLVRLVDELLDVSRITAHRLALEREPVDLTEIVREIAARFSDELQRAGTSIELALAEPVIGSWDRVRIEQVVSNLISNAIKYGCGKPVTVEVERVPTGARLVVRDRGIGIEGADQARIFDRFERAAPLQHFGGFGLGLWITRQVVEAHGGSISVTSEPGVGSTFSVDLPLDGGEDRGNKKIN